MNFDMIFENNRKWAMDKLRHGSDYFKNLAKGQNPKILYIGCSDSRITPDEMMGTQLGDLLVYRNIGNIVPASDISALSIINYAVDHLKVKHIIVCGHYGCGGVNLAMQSLNVGILNPWLQNIRDVYRLHKEELNAIDDKQKRNNRLVELNVQEQCMNVLKTPEVQVAYKAGDITIHGWVFDIHTGHIIDLNIDFKKYIDSIREIYRME